MNNSNDVLHVITTIDLGGAEKQLLILAGEQIKMGKKVAVLFLKGLPSLRKSFSELGVSVITDLHDRNFFMQVLLLRRLLKRERYNLVHSHLPKAELVSSLATFGLCKMGVSRHNAEPFWPKAPKIISTALSRVVTHRSYFVIAISRAVKVYLIESREVKEISKIHVVLYGYDPLSSRSVQNILKTSRLNALMIARLVKQKNHIGLFGAISEIPKLERPSVTLVGAGSLEIQLKELAKSLKIEDELIWIQRLNNVREEIKAYDLFILPSHYEGFGLVILEAMSAAIPIIASNCAALVEVLGEDYIGLFDLGRQDALTKKLIQFNDPHIRTVARDYLLRRLEEFSPVIMNSRIEQVYLSTNIS